MPTIKRKVEMNLPQLIEWLWKSKKSVYKVTSNMNGVVKLEPYGLITFSSGDFYPEETFTVEVEEEITEETVIPESLVVFEHNGNLYTERHNSKCISKLLCLDKKVKGSDTKTIYIMNDDLTMTLIWKNGRLVE